MRESDLAPFLSIEFDRLFDLMDETLRLAGDDNYPPYDIASLAVTGFTPEEITLRGGPEHAHR